MRKLATGMLNKAFTLIEILVVIIIITIAASVALVYFGDFGASRQARISAEHFVSYVKLLQQKAILESLTIGLQVDDDGYQPFVYSPPNQWDPISDQSLFKKQILPKNIFISGVRIDKSNSKKVQTVIINPSGDLDPFNAYFGTQAEPKMILVNGTHDGKLPTREVEQP